MRWWQRGSFRKPDRARSTGSRFGAGLVGVVLLASACGGGSGDGVALLEVEPPRESESTEMDESGSATDRVEGLSAADDGGAEVDGAPVDDVVPPSQMRVDQFGYRPRDPKVAVIADPQVGYDAEISYEPGEQIEVRRADDDEVVFAGQPVPWSGGAIHEQSGDRGWTYDFTSVVQPGTYYLYDPATDDRTGTFEISPDVYDDALDAALRAFWFNRANVEHPPELAGPWADGPAYVGPNQDTEARSVDARDDAGTARDLSGGWFDAGDTNKYVTFAMEPVHTLLSAYRRHPAVFHDDLGIPESGNGVPDVLDEVKWELDWLERMQLDDGSVLTKVGVIEWGGRLVPSESALPRFYEEACSSATIAAAGMFAHGALVLSDVAPYASDAVRLRDRAIAAWDNYQAGPQQIDCDPQVVRAGDADLSTEAQDQAEVVAAVYLAALTGSDRYHRVVASGYADTLPFVSEGFGHYGPDTADALDYYRTLPGADPGVAAAVSGRMRELARSSSLMGFDPEADLYRAYLPDASYHWGSNMVKANVGRAALEFGGGREGAERALAHANYLHGVNPLGLVYLSNMESLGAERSVQYLFHYWFGERTVYDRARGSEVGVAPGYLVGGPNAAYSGTAAPPAGQPPQKSYRDWSAYGSEPSWELTEPAIYYQSAYVGLLAALIGS